MDEENTNWLEEIWYSWRARIRMKIVDIRQRLALALWTSDGRLPGSSGAPYGTEGFDSYDITVRYSEGCVIHLSGACTRDRTTRLTGFMSIFEKPFYQILVTGGAELHVDATKALLSGLSISHHGVGLGVLNHSVVTIKGPADPNFNVQLGPDDDPSGWKSLFGKLV